MTSILKKIVERYLNMNIIAPSFIMSVTLNFPCMIFKQKKEGNEEAQRRRSHFLPIPNQCSLSLLWFW
jgi:hypothetical protein